MKKPPSLQPAYRSKLEKKVAAQLGKERIAFGYETKKIRFVIPARDARYTPDFECGEIIIEAKGYFRKAADRQRLVFIKDQNPTLDLRLVFQDANKPIYKGSKTTYAGWADKNGFPWATKGTIPPAWLKQMKRRAK